MIIKKLLTVLLITLILFRSVFPVVAFAEEDSSSTPSDTPTEQSTPPSDEAPSVSPSDSPTPTDAPSPSDSPTPSVDPEVSVSPSPDETSQADLLSAPTPDTSVNNSAGVENNVSSDSDSGNNSASSSAQNNNSDIDTGDSISNVTAENDVNTTEINSQVFYQTINIYAQQDSDLDLSVPSQVVNDLIKNKNISSGNINISMIDNSSYVINNISTTSNTGNNEGGNVSTGNAYSITTLLNKINFTVINSQVHIVTVNIFGNMNGNIMLPQLTQDSATCSICGSTQNLNNSATVTNNIDSDAISGQNVTSSSGTINTQDAINVVSLYNLINQTYIDSDIASLFINDFGDWSGYFLGYANQSPAILHGTLVDSNISPNSAQGIDTDINNSAVLENDINSLANSGGNTGQNIHTGKAISLVSLINFVNTTFINSHAFFGFINIFGKLTGNIGSKNLFTNSQDTSSAEPQGSSNAQESGGVFDISTSNNVGAYVLPGDTVTFFVKVRNTGTGKIYNSKLNLNLVKDGQNLGGGTFDLGDIAGGESVKLSTGFVLGKDTPQGVYQGQAYVTGQTGGVGIDGLSNSNFNLKVFSSYGPNIQSVLPIKIPTKILSAKNIVAPKAMSVKHNQNYIMILFLIIGLYLFLEKFDKDKLFLAVKPGKNKKSKRSKK